MILSTKLISRIAGAILLCPPDSIEQTLPMMEPLPESWNEWQYRRHVDTLLKECWGEGDGFEVQLVDEWIVNGGSLYGSNDLDRFSLYRPSTYGEVTSVGARQLFDRMGMTSAKNGQDLVFMDLGWGAGKLAAQAYLEVCPKRSIGVELAPTRHQVALLAKDNNLRPRLIAQPDNDQWRNRYPSDESKLEFILGDLFQTDVSTATHIYISSLCFDPQMMQDLQTKIVAEATQLQCVASLKEFPDKSKAKPSDIEYMEMSWTKPKGSPVYLCTPDSFR